MIQSQKSETPSMKRHMGMKASSRISNTASYVVLVLTRG